MRVVAGCTALRRFYVVALALTVVLTASSARARSCLGDCDGDGEVTIDELLRAVNIVLDVEPVGTCLGYGNASTIAVDMVISAVNFALLGCPGTPTATVAVPSPTFTVASTATATPTGPTRTPSPTPTRTFMIGPRTSPTATETFPPLPTTSTTPSPGVTPDESTAGKFVAGRVPLFANMATALNNVISSLTVSINAINVSDGNAGVLSCPEGGSLTQSCGPSGSEVVLDVGADGCSAVAAGGGTLSFNGSTTLQGDGFCPVPFNGSYNINTTGTFAPTLGMSLNIAANLQGAINATNSISKMCLITAISGTLNGSLNSTFTDGSGSQVSFNGTSFTFTSPTYNFDCVPLVDTLTLTGSASVGDAASGDKFDVFFNHLTITQDARQEPATTRIEGGIGSNCIGLPLTLHTATPLAIVGGELCPRAGSVTASAIATSSVVYRNDTSVDLDITSDGVVDFVFPSCTASALLACGS
ncbi:MAG TPA: hypothetical protein VMT89_00025 [Candidatus Acidoferrales bacterium]|nr:hypothetical protein [Candidatus Acidoferrales bacterium]